jgi:hypothetical protein
MKIIKSLNKKITIARVQHAMMQTIDDILFHGKDGEGGKFEFSEEDKKEIKHFLIMLTNRIQRRAIGNPK